MTRARVELLSKLPRSRAKIIHSGPDGALLARPVSALFARVAMSVSSTMFLETVRFAVMEDVHHGELETLWREHRQLRGGDVE